MVNKHTNNNLIGIIYFIDPHLKKNKTYYQAELAQMTKDSKAELYLFYGKELFGFFNHARGWNQILKYLKKWKGGIPEIPGDEF